MPVHLTDARLAFAVAALLLLTAFAAGPRTQSPEQPAASAADAQGAALLVRMCNDCHDSARIVEKRRTKADWQNVLTKMIENGASGESQEFEALFAFLCRNHGEVRINDAASDEIASTLGLTKKDADAVVAYRNANGKFSGLDGLRKIPDIDIKTLDAHKDAVVF